MMISHELQRRSEPTKFGQKLDLFRQWNVPEDALGNEIGDSMNWICSVTQTRVGPKRNSETIVLLKTKTAGKRAIVVKDNKKQKVYVV